MKIAVLDGFLVNPGDISWEPIAGQGEFVLYESTEPQELTDHIGNAEAVFVNRCNIDAAAMDACPDLRFINTFATGFNMIDIAAAKEGELPCATFRHTARTPWHRWRRRCCCKLPAIRLCSTIT